MSRSKANAKNSLSLMRSASPKRIITLHNSINDIINKFENSKKILNHVHYPENGMQKIPPSIKKPFKQRNANSNLNNCHVNNQINLKNRRTWTLSALKMVDSISDDAIDNDNMQFDDGNSEHSQQNNNNHNAIETSEIYDGIENINDPIIYEYVPLEREVNERPTRFMRLRNINIVQCQLNFVQRFIGLLLSVPFFSSVNGAGLSTLTCAFFLPRFLCENLLYPIFRLILGTLYPAYASYKAVRNKDVKDYVSKCAFFVYYFH